MADKEVAPAIMGAAIGLAGLLLVFAGFLLVRAPKMSEEKKMEIAKEYVDKQLQTMKQYGSAPKQISEEEYKTLIEEVAQNVRT